MESLISFSLTADVSPYFDKLQNSVYFTRAIQAVLCSFVGFLLTVAYRFASNIPWDIPRSLLGAAALLALLSKVDIIWVVLSGTIISLFFL